MSDKIGFVSGKSGPAFKGVRAMITGLHPSSVWNKEKDQMLNQVVVIENLETSVPGYGPGYFRGDVKFSKRITCSDGSWAKNIFLGAFTYTLLEVAAVNEL